MAKRHCGTRACAGARIAIPLILVFTSCCGCSTQGVSGINAETPAAFAAAGSTATLPPPPEADTAAPATASPELAQSPSPTPTPTPSLRPTADLSMEIINPKLVIKKTERVLELWDGDRLCGSFSIALGWEPTGHKQAEGDGRTPEGSYYVCLRNGNSNYYLSLGISYPNKGDAKAALDAGTINQSTYRQIADAIDGKARPPWNTPLGGEIMIHGGGADSDWTAGCVAVDNDVMDILWKFCPKGTPIEILP